LEDQVIHQKFVLSKGQHIRISTHDKDGNGEKIHLEQNKNSEFEPLPVINVEEVEVTFFIVSLQASNDKPFEIYCNDELSYTKTEITKQIMGTKFKVPK
jgi:hypothetical protein